MTESGKVNLGAPNKVHAALLDGEDRVLFEIAPIPIWLEDWSAVERFCEEQKRAGTTDLRSLLESDPDLLRSTVSLVEVVEVNQRAADFVGATDRAALIGPLPGELLNTGTLDSLIDQIVTVWERRSILQTDISGVDLGGADIACQLDWAALNRDGRPDYSQVVVVVHDVSHHRASERTMHEHVDQLETLLNMGRGMASTFDIDTILELLAAVGTKLLDAGQALIALVDVESREVTRRVTLGTLGTTMPLANFDEIMERLPGWAMRSRTATLSNDLPSDTRSEEMPPELAAALAGRPAAVAPIAKDDLVLGVLVILREVGAPVFTDMDLSLVRMLAMQAAVAIRNAELYEELRANRDYLHTAHEELKDTQVQLLAAQKMEAIGSLASGIAHEINTPIQFVSDNTTFIRESLASIAEVAAAQRKFLDSIADSDQMRDEIARLQELWDDHDFDFLLAELPQAVDESLEGARRVAEIVRAMKEFAHPGSQTKSTVDVNRVIETTLQVSRNEWKYVADLVLDLDDNLPTIEGHGGPLGQSLLIMFVNSAQAIAEHRNTAEDGKGTIRVSTRHLDGAVEIRVADNGPGIPQEIIERIFDPFFTTKEVGKGSGQGLSIARSVVVDKHGGKLWVEQGNPGAVFVMRLPVDASAESTADSKDE